MTTASSLLFVRSVPPAMAVPALKWVRRYAGGATITALTSAGGRLALEGAGVVDACEIYDAPRLGVFAAGLGRIRRLAKREFDVVIVPYAGDRRDYWNVARFALALRGGATWWLRCDLAEQGASADAVLRPVSLADWWRETRTIARLRNAALGAIKWPALVAGYVIGMAALTALAAILLPLVWLKPSEGPRNS